MTPPRIDWSAQLVGKVLALARKMRRWRRFSLLNPPNYPVLDPSNRDISPLVALGMADRMPIVINVRLEDCRWTGASGLRYGPDSTHPYVETLREYRRLGTVCARKSALWEYYKDFQPATLADFQGIGEEEGSLLGRLPPLNIYPWSGVLGETLRQVADGFLLWPYTGALRRSYVCVRSVGPQCPEFVEERVEKLTSLYDTISKNTFQTLPNPSIPYFEQFIVGDVLVRGGETRMMLASGQHRASVLSSRGHTTAPILIGVRHHRGPSVIRRDDVEGWPLVRERLYEVEEALKVFDGIFDGCGPQPQLRT